MTTRIKNTLSLYFLIICFCFILAESGRAQSGNYNGLAWEQTSTNAVEIAGYTGSNGAVIIPGTIPVGTNNLLVTSIGTDAFGGSQVTSVTIPDSVTNIGSGAFEVCFSLTNVVLGSSVQIIGDHAFDECFHLASINIPIGVTSIGTFAFYFSGPTSISIPDSVTNIGSLAFTGCGMTNVTIGSGVISIGTVAFAGCQRLLAITVDPENSFYSSSSNGVLCDKNQATLIAFPGGVGGSYTIPDSVTTIGLEAFANDGLTNVTIPDSVTNIGGSAFAGSDLASVTIGTNIASIGEDAFRICYGLQAIYFRGNAPIVDSTVFGSDAADVTAYYLPGTTNWSVFSVNAGIPATLWLPQIQTGASGFGVQTNLFGFNINWTSGQTITIEACTDLFSPNWQPLQTNTFKGNSLNFSDAQATNYPARFYRIISP